MAKFEELPFDAYLRTVLAQLRMLTPAERSVIEAELEGHLADAATERGCCADDPALQASVVAALGPAKPLGKAWAQAYCPLGSRMRGSIKVVFWVLWFLANTVAGGLGYMASSIWFFPLTAAVATVLQALLLYRVVGVWWWWQWLLVSLVPWLALTGLYATVLWDTLTDPHAEVTLVSSVLLANLLIGVLQWRVLRDQVSRAGVWAGVPLVSLMSAWILSTSLNVTLLGMPDMIAWLGGWDGMFLLIGLVFGAIQGIVTGSILLVLMSLRQVRYIHRLA